MGSFGLVIFVVTAFVAVLSPVCGNEATTLKLVFTLFRHGDRTNDPVCTWPTDPHQNETYEPYGLGQLTNEGKQREFALGKLARRRYGAFLGKTYTPDVLEPVVTAYNRTKASLSLFLAGLYPPAGTSMEWERTLNWQPIPYNCLTPDTDHVLSYPIANCPHYINLFNAYVQSPEGQVLEQKYFKYFGYVGYHTGLNITQIAQLNLVAFGLFAQKEWGLPLPDWARDIYPVFLNVAADNYLQATGTTEMKQLTGGFLLNDIIRNTRLKLTNKLEPKGRKMFIYSAHEYNVAYLLRALDLFKPHVPPYGACIFIEVHRINGVNGVKIFYEDYTGIEPRPMRIPGCEYFCPFPKFVKLVQKHLPPRDNMCDGNVAVLQSNRLRSLRYF